MTVACDLCGSEDAEEFIVLNRAGIVTPGGRSWLEWHGKRSERYLWDPEQGVYSGRAFCFPACLHSFLEGLIVEHKYEERHGRR